MVTKLISARYCKKGADSKADLTTVTSDHSSELSELRNAAVPLLAPSLCLCAPLLCVYVFMFITLLSLLRNQHYRFCPSTVTFLLFNFLCYHCR